MEVMGHHREEKLENAKKRVEKLKGFYIHLGVYLVVNLWTVILEIIRNMSNGKSFLEAFWDFGTFSVWLFWGIGLVFHGLKAFSYVPFFNKEWEEKQIRKYLEKEKGNLKDRTNGY